ncbi:MAG: signal recognition particle-docking protein FtsY [Bifidobacteriaceae bacterium]|jgi:fused signal recognition particle receptor|nr:signal recognition particle-docking protein FtsY [Bifidobacteriaceae bacterium]
MNLEGTGLLLAAAGAVVTLALIVVLVYWLVRRGPTRGPGSGPSTTTRTMPPGQPSPEPDLGDLPDEGVSEGSGAEPASEPATEPTAAVSGRPVGEATSGTAPKDLEAAAAEAAAAARLEVPEAPATRLQRLRARLAGSKSALGKALLAVLSRDQLTQDDWDEFEETLLMADVGTAASEEILQNVREAMRVEGAGASPAQTLRQELLAAVASPASRGIMDQGEGGDPGVILVVGVNGSGKTTTIGRLARLEVAEGNTVILGAADTFRAAAADQLATWGERVGVHVVRGPEGSDPASVAFDAVAEGIDRQVDTVIIDTAGRLHNKANLMGELEKIKRVASKRVPITETLLVLDATTGQNGLTQARVFTEAVDVTGIVLTKLDGTAKGGIVIAVQRELGVPVKLVGLGEGPDDLAPFDPEAFVDGLTA